MLIKTYSLRPHCVSCWTTYIVQDDTRSLQCQVNVEAYVLVITVFDIIVQSLVKSVNLWFIFKIPNK